MRSIVTELIPASRYQDATTSPSASARIRLVCAPRPPHLPPTFSDDRETPLLPGRRRAKMCPRFARRRKHACLRHFNTTGKSSEAREKLSRPSLPFRIDRATARAQSRTIARAHAHPGTTAPRERTRRSKSAGGFGFPDCQFTLLVFVRDAPTMILRRPNRFHFSTQFRPATQFHSSESKGVGGGTH